MGESVVFAEKPKFIPVWSFHRTLLTIAEYRGVSGLDARYRDVRRAEHRAVYALVGGTPAYFAAFVLHWPPVFVYAIMKMDEPVKDLFVWIRMRAAKWLRDVTR